MLREFCLRFFILVLVFILCEKTGNVFVIFCHIFSTFHKKRMRTCIKNLRHSSLHSNVFSMYQRVQAYIVHSKGDIHIQKIIVKICIFVYSYPCPLNQQVYFHIIYIIRKASYSILYVLNFMDITTESIMKLALPLRLIMLYHPCLSLSSSKLVYDVTDYPITLRFEVFWRKTANWQVR